MKEFGKENYFNVRGNIYLALGKYNEALNDFEKCIQIKSSFSLAYVNKAIAKINLANKIEMTTLSIKGGFNNQPFIPNRTLLLRTSMKKSDSNIIAALEGCNKAIEIEPKLYFAFYVRGQIKKMINKSDYCLDLLQAKELGYAVQMKVLIGCGK